MTIKSCLGSGLFNSLFRREKLFIELSLANEENGGALQDHHISLASEEGGASQEDLVVPPVTRPLRMSLAGANI